jgi:hypothetical protein
MPRVPSPLESLLNKMLLAGWITEVGFLKKPHGKAIRGIAWSDQGLLRSVAIGLFVAEIDRVSGLFTDSELLLLVRIIRAQSTEHQSF